MSKEKLILTQIINDDPDNLLEIDLREPITHNITLINSFNEINNFYKRYNKEPSANKNDFYEFQLYASLKNIKKSNKKINILSKYDKHSLLYSHNSSINSLEDIFNDDPDGLLNEDKNSLFDLKGPIKDFARAKTDFVARRKVCKNFNKYEKNFQKVQLDLSNRNRNVIPFREGLLKENRYFIHNGILFFLESINTDTDKQKFDSGVRSRIDGRTRCIFENGTESEMKFRSLVKILNQNGKAITEHTDDVNKEFNKNFEGTFDNESIETGVIYILKSKNNDKNISSIENLYKIGYTKNLEIRLKNCEKDPTFLMSSVEVMSSYKVYDVPAIKIESLIQKFFQSCKLSMEIIDNKNKQYVPEEWYIVPLDVIEQAIILINKGKLNKYKYDFKNNEIINN